MSRDQPAQVVDLQAYRVTHCGDDAGFLACPRCEGDDWAVVCRGTTGRPFIAALVCVVCDPPFELSVVNGVLQHG